MLPTETKWTTRNYTTLNTKGMEISLVSILKEKLPLVNTVFVNFTRYWVNKKEGDFNSYYALDFVKHNLKFGVNHQTISKLSFNWEFNWQDRAGEYKDVNGAVHAYKPFWLIDLKVNWTGKTYIVYAEVNNLFDKKNIDVGNIPQPGRWGSLGFIYKIKW